MSKETTFVTSLISGGIAGTTVDICLYPLDTIKTRLQSSNGFLKSGGFRGVYKGLGIAALGSAPGAALFFSTYEKAKHVLSSQYSSNLPQPAIHMIAASFGESMACLVRVPIEVIKQRMQTGVHNTITATVKDILVTSKVGPLGLYKGFGITLLREIPFSFIQFPIYEYFKKLIHRELGRPATSYEAALCGSVSGGIAAALTTPLDVMKTRLMIGTDVAGVAYKNIPDTIRKLYLEGQGVKGGPMSVFFRGVSPRVMWISIGGFFFFGAYEQSKHWISSLE